MFGVAITLLVVVADEVDVTPTVVVDDLVVVLVNVSGAVVVVVDSFHVAVSILLFFSSDTMITGTATHTTIRAARMIQIVLRFRQEHLGALREI